MPIPDQLPPLRTYYDPRLWDRLHARLREKLIEKQAALLNGTWQTYEQAREVQTWCAALSWVFDEAAELTKVEPDQEEC